MCVWYVRCVWVYGVNVRFVRCISCGVVWGVCVRWPRVWVGMSVRCVWVWSMCLWGVWVWGLSASVRSVMVEVCVCMWNMWVWAWGLCECVRYVSVHEYRVKCEFEMCEVSMSAWLVKWVWVQGVSVWGVCISEVCEWISVNDYVRCEWMWVWVSGVWVCEVSVRCWVWLWTGMCEVSMRDCEISMSGCVWWLEYLCKVNLSIRGEQWVLMWVVYDWGEMNVSESECEGRWLR